MLDTKALAAEVKKWLSQQPDIAETLASILRIASYPASIQQNEVLDVIDEVVGQHPNITRDRWVPEWNRLSEFEAPLDHQRLWVPPNPHQSSYEEVLPHLATTVYVLDRGEGPTFMLNGHVDVVPVEDQQWTARPFEAAVRNGRMVARGAMDMKAGLLAAALAFRYLAENWSGSGRILFAAVPEEETGGNGTLAALYRGYAPDAVVFTEPTDLRVVHRHVGIQSFQIDVTGLPGGMLRRSWGDSAAPTLARAALALEGLEAKRTQQGKGRPGYEADDLPGYVNFTMSAGDWIATRAASGRIKGLMGVLPGETQLEAATQLRDAVDSATAEDKLPVVVTVHPGGHRGAEISEKHSLVRAFVDQGAKRGSPGSATTAGTMVCDAKIVSGGGWAPSIVLGPIGGNLHSADEWVDLSSIHTLIEMLVSGTWRFFNELPADN